MTMTASRARPSSSWKIGGSRWGKRTSTTLPRMDRTVPTSDSCRSGGSIMAISCTYRVVFFPLKLHGEDAEVNQNLQGKAGTAGAGRSLKVLRYSVRNPASLLFVVLLSVGGHKPVICQTRWRSVLTNLPDLEVIISARKIAEMIRISKWATLSVNLEKVQI